MLTTITPAALGIAAIASGLVAGVFLAFSDFIMRALTATNDAVGMPAMQSINRIVYRSVFLGLFMALVPASIALAALAGTAQPASSPWAIAGALVYLLGVFAVTAGRNVPMNKRLDRLSPETAGGAAYWQDYGREWTRWNHIRTIAALIATTCFVVALAKAG